MSKHNHITRDIKPLGQCLACDEYHDKNIPSNKAEKSKKATEKVLAKYGLKITDLSERDQTMMLAGYDLALEVSK